jgi:hypothetical protein
LLLSFPKEFIRLLDGVIFLFLLFLSAKLIDAVINFLSKKRNQSSNRSLDKLEKAGVPLEKRKEHAEWLTKMDRQSYNLDKGFGWFFLVIFILISLVLSSVIADFLRASFDVFNNKDEITIPAPVDNKLN